MSLKIYLKLVERTLCSGIVTSKRHRLLRLLISVPRRSKVSAKDVTAKAIYKCLMLVPRWRSEAKSTSISSAPTPPPLTIATVSRFPCLFVQRFCLESLTLLQVCFGKCDLLTERERKWKGEEEKIEEESISFMIACIISPSNKSAITVENLFGKSF